MRLRLRLLWLIIASFIRGRRSLADETVLNLRVLPNDVDLTRVSNDRYLTFMDLGRINIVLPQDVESDAATAARHDYCRQPVDLKER